MKNVPLGIIDVPIGIIGFGHMGKAIFQALKKNSIKKNGWGKIYTSDGEKNAAVAKKSKVIILAVKPVAVREVLREISQSLQTLQPLQKDQLIISIAAGISLRVIENELRKNFQRDRKNQKGRQHPRTPALVRVMPNLPAQTGSGMSVWKSLKPLNPRNKTLVKSILRAFGEEIEVKSENLIDSATAVSGSGPAYVFAFLSSLAKSANKLGFSQAHAKRIALQTVSGSSLYANHSPSLTFDKLVSQVKTKGGTTEAAFKILDKKKWQAIFEQAIFAAYRRAKKL